MTKQENERTADSAAPKTQVTIKAPNMQRAQLNISGDAPLVINCFSSKSQKAMEETQAAGSTSKSKKKKEAKNFDALFEAARHKSKDGWDGIPAGAFRAAAVRACDIVGFKMTQAKLAIFVEADGVDAADGTPLVRILGPEPEQWVAPVRNATGVMDLRSRPRWNTWGASVTVRFDADVFTLDDVVNLFARIGAQVGVGEGRPFSKNSCGLGFGLFHIVN